MLLNSIHSQRGETADIQEEEEGTVVTEHPDSMWFPRGLDLGNKTMSFFLIHTHTHTDILSLMRADKLLCAVGHVARHSLGARKETQRGGHILEEFKYQFVDHVT